MVGGLFMYLVTMVMGFAFGIFKRVPNQYKVKGDIVSLEQNNRVRKSPLTYTAVVAYEVDGKIYNVRSSHQSSFYKVGKRLTVCYNVDKPEESFVKSRFLLYLFLVVSFIIGTMEIIKAILINGIGG